MEKIEIKVTKTTISLLNGYVLNQGEYQVDKCKFEFADEYADLVKKAIFVNGDTSIDMVIINDECDIPYEVLQNASEFVLKVYGYQVENEELILRYSPTALKIFLREGSYVGSNEVITPSQFEQYEQALHDGLEEVNTRVDEIEEEIDDKIVEIDNTLSGKVAEVDDKLDEVDDTLEVVNHAIDETNNLNLDVSKQGKVATVTLTKKDASTKVVTLSDGTSLMFNWDGTKLGIKTDEEAEYTYVDLQGVQGPVGPQGEAFKIKKTYSSVAEMNADFYNMNVGDYVMIASDVETEDNAKLYTRGERQWIFISDFSGAQGIKGETGATPNIQIGSVVSGTAPNVTRTGTNENPILNFTLQKGDKGDKGNTGDTGATGNGIVSVEKTATIDLVDTYTITFTDGTTTTFQITNGEDGEVTQGQLDDVQNQIDYYKTVMNALPKVNASGEVLALDNTVESPMTMLPNGNTKQDSTSVEGGDQYDSPTPEHVQEIKSVSGDNEIIICGSNIFNKDSGFSLGYINNSGVFQSQNFTALFNQYINIEENIEVTFGVKQNISQYGLIFYNKNKTYISRTTGGNNNVLTATTPKNTKYMRIQFNYNNTDTMTQSIIDSLEPRVNLGSTKKEYVAFGSKSYPITLSNQGLELNQISGYKDYFAKIDGTWNLIKNINRIKITSATSYVANGSNQNYAQINCNITSYGAGINLRDNGYMNYFSYYANATASSKEKSGFTLYNGNTLVMSVPRTICRAGTEKSDFDTWASSNDLYYVYILANSLTIPVTDSTLKQQLDDIEYAMSNQGGTSILQENDNSPFIIDASAIRDMSGIFELIQGTEL